MTEQERKQYEALPYPVSFSCVDILCIHEEKIAMITKEGDPMLRLPGGFIDPTDLTIEDAARREASEEIGLSEPSKVHCYKIGREFLTRDEGRYNPDESKHRLRTHLVEISALNDKLTAGDDAETVRWVDLHKFNDIAWVVENIISGHVPIIFWWLGNNGRY